MPNDFMGFVSARIFFGTRFRSLDQGVGLVLVGWRLCGNLENPQLDVRY